MIEGPTASRRPWVRALGAFALYLAGSIAIWGLPVVGHLGSRYVAVEGGDPDFYRWALAWTPRALAAGESPLFSSLIYAPDGARLAWTALTPGAAIVMWPITAAFGTLVSYNVLMLLAPALAGWAAYLACTRLTQAFWPSLIGGALFAFSTYMAGHMQAHLNLVLIFPVPLAVYLTIRRIEGSLGPVAFVALLSVTLLGLFLLATELFATTTLFGTIGLVLALAAAGADRRRVLAAALQVGAALAIVTAVVFAPYLLPALRNAPSDSIRSPERAAADLAGWVIPRTETAIGGGTFARVTQHFTASVLEDGSYMGVALVALVVGFAVTERRRRSTWAVVAFVGVVVLLSLGTVLHLGGHEIGPMPTAALWDLPLIKHATPQRFPAYAALAIGVVAAVWIARGPGSWIRWTLAVLGLVSLLPSVSTPPWFPEDRVPAFFTSGAFRDVLREGEIVFVIPGHNGEEMLWQSQADFAFAMPEGYVGALPDEEYRTEKLFRGLSAEERRPFMPSPEELRAWIDERGTTAVILGDVARPRFQALLVEAGLRLAYEGEGVSVWRVANA